MGQSDPTLMRGNPAEPNEARRRLTLVVAGSAVAGTVILASTGWVARQPGFLAEVVLYILLAAALASIPVLRDDFLALPKAYRRWLLTLVGFAVFAQMVGGGGDVFPGARWAMFSDMVDSPNASVIVVTEADGDQVVISPSDLYGGLRNGRSGSLLGRVSGPAEEDLLRALAERYEVVTGVEVVSISVIQVTIEDTEQLTGEVVMTLLLEVET